MVKLTKKALEDIQKTSKFAESLKKNSASQKLMDEMKNMIPKIPNFGLADIGHNRLTLPEMPKIPSQEEINEYQSASVFMKSLANEALQWKEQLPENYKPAVLAFLYGGVQIHVHTLSQVSFHGIRIEGTMNGSPCSLLTHQSTVQMLCYGEEITEEAPRYPIGFIWDNNKVEV